MTILHDEPKRSILDDPSAKRPTSSHAFPCAWTADITGAWWTSCLHILSTLTPDLDVDLATCEICPVCHRAIKRILFSHDTD